ncbi:alpha/beta hydrolase [Actinoplanes sp. NPDC049548]|uniref:alpha/beta hydrolase n=1 Tax=Actinoplanes sp. NPDC049548 TaxID=3155152 RepID=UPI00343792F8
MIQTKRLTVPVVAALSLVLAATPIGSAAALATGKPAGSIAWHRCALNAQDEEGHEWDAAGIECGDVTVPVDYAKPRGRTITVAIARSRATDPAHRIGALVINLGGPASPVLGVVPLARQTMGETGSHFDLIGMDPRFAGRSTPLDCEWPSSWLPRSAGADRASFDHMVSLTRDLARRCGRKHGDDIPYASTANTARDIDAIRAALGEPKLSYLGYSQGTFLGAVYAQLFPQRVDRLVLDSAVDPTRPGTFLLRNAAPGRQAALAEWAQWAATHNSEYGLGATTEKVLATVDRIYAASARKPLKVGGYAVDDTVVPAIVIRSLTDDTSNGELAETMKVLADAARRGDITNTGTAELPESLTDVLSDVLTGAQSAVNSARTAIMCGDAAVPRDPRWYWRDIRAHRAESALFAPLSRTITPCAFWPSSPVERPVRVGNDVPALIVQAEKDTGSQLPGARKMHEALTASRMVTLQGARTHGVYGFRGAGCVDDVVDAYLVSGSLPRSDVMCSE